MCWVKLKCEELVQYKAPVALWQQCESKVFAQGGVEELQGDVSHPILQKTPDVRNSVFFQLKISKNSVFYSLKLNHIVS